MSEPQMPAPQGVVDPRTSDLADGEWHRMHPLTPLFKGGLVLLIVAGITFANLRDRVIAWFVNLFTPSEAHYNEYSSGDPVDWVLENNLILVALLVVLGILVVLIAIFWFVWRFQQFRITGDHVEVRKGIVFRSHRRAPLDRVQGVNLTRPFPARLIGLAKLEVVGAGTDANVELEYLATSKAETVRADILRLASGLRASRQQASAPAATPGARAQLVDSMNHGVNGLIAGVDLGDVAPESVVKIPAGRLIGSQLIVGVVWFLFFALLFGVTMGFVFVGALVDGEPLGSVLSLGIGLGVGIPLIVAVVGITWAQISKSLRYSIAPTPDGVRITYGLLTTVTETLPPGRIFAVEVTQSLLWRPFGWWSIKINRMSGKSAAQQSSGNAQQFNIVLPVGKRADVERVLGLILPDAPAADIPLVWEHGILGPVAGDPYRTMPRRAAWRRPLSWKRHGYTVTDFGLILRRGVVWRKLAIFPLARLQGVSLNQGPIDRAQRVSGAQILTVSGPIHGLLSGLERADALALIGEVSARTAAAAANDHTHRWSAHAPSVPATTDAPPPVPFPAGAPVPPPASGAPVPPATAPVPPPAFGMPVPPVSPPVPPVSPSVPPPPFGAPASPANAPVPSAAPPVQPVSPPPPAAHGAPLPPAAAPAPPAAAPATPAGPPHMPPPPAAPAPASEPPIPATRAERRAASEGAPPPPPPPVARPATED